MEADGFLRKYNNLMCYDKPHNSLPFIFFVAIFVLVKTNVAIAIIVEPENFEKVLTAVTDIMVFTLVAIGRVFLSLNPEISAQLAELIEDDLISSIDLAGRDKVDLKIEIEEYYEQKKKQTLKMYKNTAYSFSVLFVLVQNRNIINFLSRTPDNSESELTSWPTPFLSYCPPGLQSSIFFIHTYFLHSLLLMIYIIQGFFLVNTNYLSIEKIITICDTIKILVDHLVIDFPDTNSLKKRGLLQQVNQSNFNSEKLRQEMGRIVYCHQKVNRFSKIFDRSFSILLITAYLLAMLYTCSLACLLLTTDDLKRRIYFALPFVCLNLIMFVGHYIGQRLLNQNDVLRRSLAELPWTDKPQWFKQTLHIMMTRANVDIEIRPYRIFSLNYVSFKDLMKTTYSIGNLYK